MNPLKSHHTVKIVVIPNVKGAFLPREYRV